MPFQKGESGNAKGRPRGAKSKKTILVESVGLSTWESLEKYVTQHGVGKLIEELKKLEGRAYVVSHLEAMEYFKAKQARTEISLPIDLDSLSEEDLDKLALRMIKLAKPEHE